MTSAYDDIKRVAFGKLPIVRDLFVAYLKRDGLRFLILSETPPFTRHMSTLALLVIYVGLALLYLFLNPSLGDFFLLKAARDALLGLVALLVTSLPLYLVIRPGTRIKSLAFFLNLQMVASIITFAVMAVFVIVGLILSPNLRSDLHEISEGRGRDSVFYRVYCDNLERRRDTLLRKVELNDLTGEFDAPHMRMTLRTLFQSDEEQWKAAMPHLVRQAEREGQLPPAQRQRIRQLRTEIVDGLLSQQLNAPALTAEYPYFLYAILLSFIAVPITSLFSYIMIWKVFVSSGRARQRKPIMVFRVSTGIITSIAFTLWFYNTAMNQTLQTTFGLAEERLKLREDAQNRPFCRLDPKGLW